MAGLLTLADIYSWLESQRRVMGDATRQLVTDPKARVQRVADQAAEDTRALTRNFDGKSQSSPMKNTVQNCQGDFSLIGAQSLQVKRSGIIS